MPVWLVATVCQRNRKLLLRDLGCIVSHCSLGIRGDKKANVKFWGYFSLFICVCNELISNLSETE